MRFHHLGIACKNLDQELESIRSLHEVVSVSEIVFDPEQNARLCMIGTAEGLNIELIAGGQVENLVKKRISYYHVCYETDDLEAEIESFRDKGAFVVSDPKPAILFQGKRVAFLLVSYGLIELVES